MMQTLKLEPGDMIQVKSTFLELAKLVKLQPQSVRFLEISDPRAVLERAFRNFATLTKGDVFEFEYNDEVFSVAVLEVKPETDRMGVSMIETDVSVDFAPPVGYVEPQRVPPGVAGGSRTGSGTSTPKSGHPGGLPAGGKVHPTGTMAAAIGYDNLAPSSTAVPASNFLGAGQRIGGRRQGRGKAAAEASPSPAPPPAAQRRRNGPMPLRMPANTLFLGYEIKPITTGVERDEGEDGRKKHFEGQGQTLRGSAKKGDDGKRS